MCDLDGKFAFVEAEIASHGNDHLCFHGVRARVVCLKTCGFVLAVHFECCDFLFEEFDGPRIVLVGEERSAFGAFECVLDRFVEVEAHASRGAEIEVPFVCLFACEPFVEVFESLEAEFVECWLDMLFFECPVANVPALLAVFFAFVDCESVVVESVEDLADSCDFEAELFCDDEFAQARCLDEHFDDRYGFLACECSDDLVDLALCEANF